MPGMAACGTADGAPGPSVQGLFVDQVARPADRAADYHRASVKLKRAAFTQRQARRCGGRVRADGSRHPQTSCRSS